MKYTEEEWRKLVAERERSTTSAPNKTAPNFFSAIGVLIAVVGTWVLVAAAFLVALYLLVLFVRWAWYS